MNWYKLSQSNAGRKRKNPLATDQRMLELFDSGVNPYNIALQLDISPYIVRKVLIQNNRTINNSNNQTISSTKVKTILRMIYEKYPIQKILNRFSLSTKTLYNITARLGITPKTQLEENQYITLLNSIPDFKDIGDWKTELTETDIQNIILDYKSGMNPNEIARKYRTTYDRVTYYLVQNNAYNIKPESVHYNNPYSYSINKTPHDKNNITPNKNQE
jgi:DNA-binding CsgD family transcriptional regulator